VSEDMVRLSIGIEHVDDMSPTLSRRSRRRGVDRIAPEKQTGDPRVARLRCGGAPPADSELTATSSLPGCRPRGTRPRATTARSFQGDQLRSFSHLPIAGVTSFCACRDVDASGPGKASSV